MAVYIDTSAWIALHEPRDQNHRAAKATARALLASRTPWLTGWHTLVEFADGLARHYDQAAAALQLGRVVASPAVRIEPSEPHLTAARAMFSTRTDWGVDLSGCLSFAMMDALGVRRAFTYDRDFEKAGFTIQA